MDRKPIVVGVDGSPESVRAAVAGCMVARRTGARCQLVHAVAVSDYLAKLPPELLPDVEGATSAATEGARAHILASLADRVPIALLDTLDLHLGRAAVVLEDVARRLDAGLVVMGAKRHRGLELLGGSAITHVLRACNVPLLATNGEGPTISRVLAAVDTSYAAHPTLDEAVRWAEVFGAQLRVLHVVEPVPVIPGVPLTVGDEEFYRSEQRLLELNVWPRIARPDAVRVIRRGLAAEAIAREVEEWHADLLVLGSHGRNWAHRLLLGSTTERIIHHLPTMTLVVPVPKPVKRSVLSGTKMPWEEAPPSHAELHASV